MFSPCDLCCDDLFSFQFILICHQLFNGRRSHFESVLTVIHCDHSHQQLSITSKYVCYCSQYDDKISHSDSAIATDCSLVASI
jgi:hypothetical protein